MLVDYTFIALCLAARSLAAPAASNGVATLKRQGNLLGPMLVEPSPSPIRPRQLTFQ